MELYKKRLQKVREKMKELSFDCLLVGPFSNMFYFSGFSAFADERLQLLVIPTEGKPVAVMPEMYRKTAEVTIGQVFTVTVWSDEVDPFQLTRQQLSGKSDMLLAVDDLLRADHLLGLIAVMPGARFKPASLLTDQLRSIKDDSEIALLKQACQVADRVMDSALAEVRPGVTEKELALFIEMAYKREADSISFNPIVASGPNSALPHYSPADRRLQEGDFIVIDCGADLRGYCSDITRTFCLGKATAEMKKVYETVHEANARVFEVLKKKSQVSGEEADRTAREIITAAGYGPLFTHRTGHGIGLEVHEAPYLVEGNDEPLLQGMAFTVEPGIYLPGQFGVRIEDTVAITAGGPERLTSYKRELIEV